MHRDRIRGELPNTIRVADAEGPAIQILGIVVPAARDPNSSVHNSRLIRTRELGQFAFRRDHDHRSRAALRRLSDKTPTSMPSDGSAMNSSRNALGTGGHDY
jgi:hypothetical protein